MHLAFCAAAEIDARLFAYQSTPSAGRASDLTERAAARNVRISLDKILSGSTQ